MYCEYAYDPSRLQARYGYHISVCKDCFHRILQLPKWLCHIYSLLLAFTSMTTFDLFSSVRDGNMDIVRHLLQSRNCRARLNHRNEWGDTALHLAAEAGNGEICQMLIAAGASVTVRNNRGETCLHRAAVGGHVSSVSAIVGESGVMSILSRQCSYLNVAQYYFTHSPTPSYAHSQH